MSDAVAAAWEAVADDFVTHRSEAGLSVVQDWAGSFPKGASILDLGCGSGWPITEALVAAGLDVRAIDASPTLVAAFRERLPDASVRCERVETSDFFDRRFDGIAIIGLMFLLDVETQASLIGRVAEHLKPGGRLLFSSPWQVGEWEDLQTGLTSRSPGRDVYRSWLEGAGLELVGEPSADAIHHFDARKPIE